MYFCLKHFPNRLILVEINKKLNLIFQAVSMTKRAKRNFILRFSQSIPNKNNMIMLTDGAGVIRCD
jgi:hypothetical protein